MLIRIISFIVLLISDLVSANKFLVKISSDDPIMKGGTVHFVATVYEGNEVSDNTNLKFYWEDNAIPQHSMQSDTKNATDLWAVTYQADKYAMGTYIVNVVVKVCLIEYICYEVAFARSYFDITETVNGKMLLIQRNKTVEKDFVSNTGTVTHEIDVKETDRDLIKNATTVLTYWFIDCAYYGSTADMKFFFDYRTADEEHTVEALLVADFNPLPPTNTTAENSDTNVNSVDVPYVRVCNGPPVVKEHKIYGYFSRRVQVKAPITDVNVTGKNRIRHGDLLSLWVQCRGSRNIEYCVEYKTGAYNVTGNETCFWYASLDACDFIINRYLSGSKYTVLIIIRNEVSRVVQPFEVTFYEGK